ncbi:hypothetical protein HBI55_117970 [Parastagonospora nodorum]|nr:hypothetical protein HBH52_063240 [Parastagonospora nodorum]KAH5224541.1 hypothetical protein HBI62_121100 [Parastagonospora nodorum]KAH5431773.1 hypothetical protein HBI32_064880 [Parastagonospora nodorum]KAH5524845.1 hypothetical protein HBI52_052690 [Parastagonospora nodorum]KAH5542388.1 hypothetical protein HBI27_078380 [Parastagonospora nodorum]
MTEAPTTQLRSITLKTLPSPQRSIEGHYSVTDHLQEGTIDAEIYRDAIVEINDDSRPRADFASEQGVWKGRFGRVRSHLRPPTDPFIDTVSSVGDLPNGFSRLAAFQAVDTNFSLYRGFAYLNSRLLLDLQKELTQLEQELEEIDSDDFEDNPDRLRSSDIDMDITAQEGDLVEHGIHLPSTSADILAYHLEDELLIKASTIRALQKPSDQMYTKMRRFQHNTRPLIGSEMDSIRCREDIITLRSGRALASFDSMIERSIEPTVIRIHRILQKIFHMNAPPSLRLLRTPALRRFAEGGFVYFYSSSRIDEIARAIVSVVVLALLVVPIVAIYRLIHPYNRTSVLESLLVLTAFALVFAATISTDTMGTRCEIFTSSDAYCALLLVLISVSSK